MGRKCKLPLIVAALEVAPAGLTQIELQRITGASAGTVHRYIHQLHNDGRAYIASWKTDQAGKLGGGVYQARYRLGKGKDVPKPPAITPAEAYRRTKARARRNGELDELRAKKAESARRRYWAKKTPKRDELVAAFFGFAANDSARKAA